VATFAYTTVTGKVGPLLEKLGQVGVPTRATRDWLRSVGFTSSNDPSLIGVLRQIGFIDANGAPTQRWKDFRGKEGRRALADAIRTGYAELFGTYPDAQERSVPDLEAFFKTHTDAGQQAIDKTVSTFRALASAADFSVAAGSAPPAVSGNASDVQGPTIRSASPTAPQGLTININVQLVIPEAADQEVYEKFFAAMRDHLISPAAS
jgi:Family of unknown function (DUF5343)